MMTFQARAIKNGLKCFEAFFGKRESSSMPFKRSRRGREGVLSSALRSAGERVDVVE